MGYTVCPEVECELSLVWEGPEVMTRVAFGPLWRREVGADPGLTAPAGTQSSTSFLLCPLGEISPCHPLAPGPMAKITKA